MRVEFSKLKNASTGKELPALSITFEIKKITDQYHLQPGTENLHSSSSQFLCKEIFD